MAEYRTVEAEPYTALEIESLKDELEDGARGTGERHSAALVAAGRQPAPLAYQATVGWHAVEVIEQLQRRIEELESSRPDPSQAV